MAPVGLLGKGSTSSLVRGVMAAGGQPELVFSLGFDEHRHAAHQLHDGAVAHEGGHRDDHLVPLVHDGPHGDVDAFAAAHGHHHLARGVVAQAEAAQHIFGNLPAQLHQTGVGGVLGEALLQRVDARVPYVPGRDEVGLAHAQGNGVAGIHVFKQVEELADARGGDALYAGRKRGFIVDHTNNTLSSCSGSLVYRWCFSLYFFSMKWVAVPVTPSMTASRACTNSATARRLWPVMVTARS